MKKADEFISKETREIQINALCNKKNHKWAYVSIRY